jgi:protein-S-isoprenylcysteine O-methyltransferase Ste14
VAHRGYYTRKFPASNQDTVVARSQGRSSILAGALAIVGLVSLLVYLVAPSLLSWSSIGLPAWIRWGGVAIAAGGYGLLQWSQNALGTNWSDRPRITREQELVTWGPYRWIRHPIYCAFLLILGSPLLIADNWFIGGAWIAMTLLSILGRIRFEEDRMLERFGES